MQENARGTYESGGKVSGEYRGMPGNVQEWRQSARGTQGNAGDCRGIHGNAMGTYGSGCKVPGECLGMQGNARGTYGSGYKLPGECRELPGECKGAGVKC